MLKFGGPGKYAASQRCGAFEFDHVAIWVAEVKRQTITLGTKVDFSAAPWRNAKLCQVRDQTLLIEWLNAQTKMVNISSATTRRSAAARTECSVNADEVNHGGPRSKVKKPQIISLPDDLTPQDGAVELDAARKVFDSENEMVDPLDREWNQCCGSVCMG